MPPLSARMYLIDERPARSVIKCVTSSLLAGGLMVRLVVGNDQFSVNVKNWFYVTAQNAKQDYRDYDTLLCLS